ncbi:helix-turn-helix domain-containing protein [Nonomuraea longicatena]|uniref:TetR/AcrR family transcriptional regulator n=1 Tax=Nonomuraea longicatena TaxID=83682 RepID=A0ABN1QKJ1_9ACTN
MSESNRERADRVLDAAAELLVRHGARKVTVDDIALRAGVGKGTLYLHWPTKHRLFAALYTREALAYVRLLAAEMRRDPASVRPHRLLPYTYLSVTGRPVLRALLTGDGAPLQSGGDGDGMRREELMAWPRLHDVLVRHGLLRSDVPDLPYTLKTISAGYYLLDAMDPEDARGTEAKAESFAYVVRAAFEPPGEPGERTLAEAAAEVVAIAEELVPQYEKWIYER